VAVFVAVSGQPVFCCSTFTAKQHKPPAAQQASPAAQQSFLAAVFVAKQHESPVAQHSAAACSKALLGQHSDGGSKHWSSSAQQALKQQPLPWEQQSACVKYDTPPQVTPVRPATTIKPASVFVNMVSLQR
jgi:hypothetical protein